MADIQPQEVIDGLQKFNRGFKEVRHIIEEMSNEQLVELYQQAKEISNISWLIRVVVLGTAKSRAVRGDGALASIAKEFGIGIRLAQLDVSVYEAFIRDKPDFEPLLPAIFYQIASSLPNPEEAFELAVEQRANNPAWPISAFKRLVEGKPSKEPAGKGLFILVPCEAGITLQTFANEAGLDDNGITELHGKVSLYSIAGHLYAQVQ